MQRDVSAGAGIGFAVIVSALTFLAIVAGFFLIREPSNLASPDAVQLQPQVSMVSPDVKRGPDTKPSSAARPGINPAPRPAQ
jgi:hypothetical protein